MVNVTVVCSPAARDVFEEELTLRSGATAREAVLASRLVERFPQLDWEAMTPGIWGRLIAWDRALVNGDRVELCRPLLVDPKMARRERFQQQGSRGAGLFARRREGGKAGY